MTSVAIRAANYLERRIQLSNAEPLPKWTALRSPHSSRRASPLRSDGMAGPALSRLGSGQNLDVSEARDIELGDGMARRGPRLPLGYVEISDRDDQTTSSLPTDPTVPVGTLTQTDSRPGWHGTAVTSNA